MASLPQGMAPLAYGYGLDEPGGVLRTDVAGGSPRYGLDWDRGVQRFKITLLLDPLKFSVWTAFYHYVIRKGAIAFDMPLDSGFGESTHSANIVPGSYQATRTSGMLWAVTFLVEAENQVYAMSAEDAALLVDFYDGIGDNSSALLARIEQFMLTDTLVLVGL